MLLPQKKLILGLLLALVIAALAAPPLWWSTGNPPVIDPAATENNHSPANIGQAKHMAKSALEALRPILPAVADQIEADLVGPGKPIPSWAAPANQAEKVKNHAPPPHRPAQGHRRSLLHPSSRRRPHLAGSRAHRQRHEPPRLHLPMDIRHHRR